MAEVLSLVSEVEMKLLTIVYTTSRRDPKFNWYFDSLRRQLKDMPVETIVVDSYKESRHVSCFRHVAPKPTVWQGKHRLTKEDRWAKSNALNTGIILCETEWIAFVDDRSALGPHWLESVERAMNSVYAVCGSYEKRANLEVKDGEAIGGEILGEDTRRPGIYPFDSWYGGSGALPLEWALQVQGFSEDMCDGLGSEDSMFGTTLLNSGYPICYDSDMRLIEDRTPGQIDGALKRADKNSHLGEKAKSWDIVRCFKNKTTSQNSFDIRNLRDRVLAGETFPPPSASAFDWYDNEPLSAMT